jgi:hypothetical protein
VIDVGTQGQSQLALASPTYTRTGGVDVAAINTSNRRNGAIQGDANNIGIRAPLDLRAQYRWSNNITLFGAIDNVQNLPIDTTLRRAYRFGIRFNY